jgi:hypothetical protein
MTAPRRLLTVGHSYVVAAGRGALSLRLGAQSLSRTGRGGRPPPQFGLQAVSRVGVRVAGWVRAGAEAFYLSRYGRGGEPKRAGEGASLERAP